MKAKTLLLLAMVCLSLYAQKHEVRAVWLTTIGGIDWPRAHTASAQKRELTNMLDQLQRAGINTVDDLINKSPEEMMRVRNLGKKSLEEVIVKLESYGLQFAMDKE